MHVFTPPAAAGKGPVLLVSGGVDSWKMDMHGLLVTLCSHVGLPVVAFDIPGTGDSQVPMSPDGAEIARGLIAHARTLGNGIVAHVGISMGGHYSARSGLAGEADAAIVLGAAGGPVGRVGPLSGPDSPSAANVCTGRGSPRPSYVTCKESAWVATDGTVCTSCRRPGGCLS
ncbi:alpha/beta fold hydrolase [Streptomyces sp. NPDC088116]|uniref:alpha/beta fold hydrolase n=1 Tax=Streptomyces sp. NPDC088116 TaxID=3365825 RepID=UPI00380D3EC2